MTLLLDLALPRTLDALVARFTATPVPRLEAWLFDAEAPRREAEKTLAAAGVQARIRSAYKPLLHFFLEEHPPQGPITITLPTGPALRWQLEAYPLAGLHPHHAITFRAGTSDSYIIEMNGQTHHVFAPNRTHQNHLGADTISPTGWLKTATADGTPLENTRLETDYEALFAAAMHTIQSHPWPETPPYFTTLALAATHPGIDRPIPYGDEVISTVEALHEDLYFSILELMKHRAGRPQADRTLQPGQIIPDIQSAPTPTIRITLSNAPLQDQILPGPTNLVSADRPLTPTQIETELNRLPGTPLLFRSVQNRPIPGRLIAGDAPAIVITAAQHANETSGVIGALRAAHRLAAEHQGTVAVIPCDNPDGYALHHRLRASNPRHMHHAARYSALGDDIDSREHPPFHERQARLDTIAQTGARLHINLHGYPAHEWTRPLTGYLPAAFELWTIPKGFFLILRHAPGLAAPTATFAEALAADLATDPALRTLNRTQLATWTAHAGPPSFAIHHDIPVMIHESPRGPDLTLITEYPDETIYDDAFRLAHTTQMRATLAATRLFRQIF